MSNNLSVVGNCILLLNCALYYVRHRRRFCLHKHYYIILYRIWTGRNCSHVSENSNDSYTRRAMTAAELITVVGR